MRRTLFIRLAVGLVITLAHFEVPVTACWLAVTPRVEHQCDAVPPQRPAQAKEPEPLSETWWRGESAQTAFGIDGPRARQLEAIFQKTLPALKGIRADVARREAIVWHLLGDANPSNESAMVQAVEDLEAARRALARTFTMMQFQMYLRLTPKQRANVHARLFTPESRSAGPAVTPR